MDRLNAVSETFVDLYGGQWCAFESLVDDIILDLIKVYADPFKGFHEGIYEDRRQALDWGIN